MNCPDELSDRDWRIVQHVYRYRVSTEPVIGRLFLPEATLSAARNVVRRLIREGWLHKWTMRGQTRYVTLDSRGYAACGLPNQSPSRFSDQTLPTLFAVLYFCIHHGFERLTPEELRAIDPEFDTPAGWAHAYFVHQVAHGLAMSCCLVDHRVAPRRLVTRARRIIADRYKAPQFRSLIHAKRFSITVLTAYAGSVAAIEQEITRRHRGLAAIQVQVVPELAALLTTVR